jgi:lipopolysaccharide/colanic/teichoic acid biosynthesis glycosyltransferase
MKSAAPAGLPRLLEAVVSSVALVVATPLLCIIGLAVALTSPGPVLFRQERVGQRGVRFTMFKFRTMRIDRRGPHVTAKADPRITSFGKFLRQSKLDELPELWNVVRGDLSLVGPRPEAIPYVDLSDVAWQEVLRVKPGITDPMTLLLRNEEDLLAAAGSDPDTFYRDFLLPYKLHGYREYISHRTWRRDIAVIWSTLLAIVVPGRAPAPSPKDIVSSVQKL